MVMVLCESCKHYGKKICMESSDYYCVDYEPNSNNESNSNVKKQGYKQMSVSLCKTCANCNNSCEWVKSFKKPVGVVTVFKKYNNLCGAEFVVNCPNYEEKR